MRVYFERRFRCIGFDVCGRLFDTQIKKDGKWKYAGGMGCSCDTIPYCF